MKIKSFASLALVVLLSYTGVVFADTDSTISNSTNSNAQQGVNVNVENGLGGGGSGEQDVGYHGSYTVKSAPTVYAPSLTASISETCWGSVSGGFSVVGAGATLAFTIKDYDCNRRLTAGVAWRMGRTDVAFNLMCQDDSFRAAAADTDKPCRATNQVAKQGTDVVPIATSQADSDKHGNMEKSSSNQLSTPVPNVIQDAKTGQLQYQKADIPPVASAK